MQKIKEEKGEMQKLGVVLYQGSPLCRWTVIRGQNYPMIMIACDFPLFEPTVRIDALVWCSAENSVTCGGKKKQGKPAGYPRSFQNMALNLTLAQNVSLVRRNSCPFLCCGIINKKILSSHVRLGSWGACVHSLKKQVCCLVLEKHCKKKNTRMFWYEKFLAIGVFGGPAYILQ